jgi:hypothetical protein
VRSASITSMIRHYVARRAKVTEGHPHNAAMRHVKIIERLAGGPRYEDPNLAFRPRGRASRTLAGSTRQA